MKKVILSENYETDALNFAKSYCDANGIKPTKKVIEKCVKQFCDELLGSVSPDGDNFIKRNPNTPKVSDMLFVDGFDLIKKFNQAYESSDFIYKDGHASEDKLRQQYVGAIMSLVNLILKIKYGIDPKGADSPFAYQPNESESATSVKAYMENITVEIERFKRLGVTTLLMAVIDDIFFSPHEEFQKFIDSTIPNPVNGYLNDDVVKKKNIFSDDPEKNLRGFQRYFRALKKPELRARYVKDLTKRIKNNG